MVPILQSAVEYLNQNRRVMYLSLAGLVILRRILVDFVYHYREGMKEVKKSHQSELIDDFMDYLHMNGKTEEFLTFHRKRISNKKS